MSGPRGKQIHLTKGERKLLARLLDSEIRRLQALAPPTGKEALLIHKLRIKQYRRIGLEVALAREESPEKEIQYPGYDESVMWNPRLKIVQDYRTWEIVHGLTNHERRRRGLPIPWTSEIGVQEMHMPEIP